MRLNEVSTPALVVDLPTMEENLQRMQRLVEEAGAKLRPHAKTHKCVEVVTRQRELGAIGITVATVKEAEVLFEAAGRDIFVANEVVSPLLIRRLFRLAQEGRIGVLVDSEAGLALLEEEGRQWPKGLDVYLDVNITDPTGKAGRCGLPPGDEAIKLAQKMHQSAHLNFQGILGYRGAPALFAQAPLSDPAAEAHRSGVEEGQILVAFAKELESRGIPVANVAAGSTPTAVAAASVEGVTEVHPGEYPFYGAIHSGPGVCETSSNAAWVVATVISRPHPGRAVINAGKKALSGDIHPAQHPNLRLRGFGIVHTIEGEPLKGVTLQSMAEEHGIIHMEEGGDDLRVGQMVRVVPNHICPVVNLSKKLLIHQDGMIIDEWKVAARGYI